MMPLCPEIKTDLNHPHPHPHRQNSISNRHFIEVFPIPQYVEQNKATKVSLDCFRVCGLFLLSRGAQRRAAVCKCCFVKQKCKSADSHQTWKKNEVACSSGSARGPSGWEISTETTHITPFQLEVDKSQQTPAKPVFQPCWWMMLA